jgi:hypothetical protein
MRTLEMLLSRRESRSCAKDPPRRRAKKKAKKKVKKK